MNRSTRCELARPTAGLAPDCEPTRASISAALDRELCELESIRMRKHLEHCASCRAFQSDAETLVTALRTPARPSSRLVTPPPETAGSARQRTNGQTHELKLTFGELALVYKSLQAAKTLGALPPDDDLLDDTIQLVDQALSDAVSGSPRAADER
jgi:predicted anti-sigma-YlaC factor YlaD